MFVFACVGCFTLIEVLFCLLFFIVSFLLNIFDMCGVEGCLNCLTHSRSALVTGLGVPPPPPSTTASSSAAASSSSTPLTTEVSTSLLSAASSANRRKNYIIFEQNDEDTLI